MSSALSLLRELVRIPSVSSQPNGPLIEHASVLLHQCGWKTEALPYRDLAGHDKINLLATPPGQDYADPRVDLAFVCHTDTVPYDPEWREAIQPELREGNLYGRGACDVKGFLACLLAAIADLQPADFRRTVRIALTADEEVGCVGAAKLVAAGVLAPRHIVVGEPTSLHPARAGKGYCLAEIKVHGKEAHSAHPAEGASAILRAARLIGKIEEVAARFESQKNAAFDPPYCTLNVGTIQGGTAKNIVAGECRFLLEWRPIPGQDTTWVPREIERAIVELKAADPTFRHELTILRDQPGFDAGADSGLVRALEKMTGKAAVAIPFGTEASFFSQLTKDIAVFGPGDMRTAHSSRECVAEAELKACTAYLRELMTLPTAI